jgi:hypothetical protein
MALGFSSYRFSLLFGLLHAVGLYNGSGFLFILCFIAHGRVILRVMHSLLGYPSLNIPSFDSIRSMLLELPLSTQTIVNGWGSWLVPN